MQHPVSDNELRLSLTAQELVQTLPQRWGRLVKGPAVLGTSIAAISRDDVVVLASDGLKLEVPRQRKFKACKIKRAGDVLYTAAGLTVVKDIGFRLTELVEYSLVGASFPEKVSHFEREARLPVRRVWEYLRDRPQVHESLSEGATLTNHK